MTLKNHKFNLHTLPEIYSYIFPPRDTIKERYSYKDTLESLFLSSTKVFKFKYIYFKLFYNRRLASKIKDLWQKALKMV